MGRAASPVAPRRARSPTHEIRDESTFFQVSSGRDESATSPSQRISPANRPSTSDVRERKSSPHADYSIMYKSRDGRRSQSRQPRENECTRPTHHDDRSCWAHSRPKPTSSTIGLRGSRGRQESKMATAIVAVVLSMPQSAGCQIRTRYSRGGPSSWEVEEDAEHEGEIRGCACACADRQRANEHALAPSAAQSTVCLSMAAPLNRAGLIRGTGSHLRRAWEVR